MEEKMGTIIFYSTILAKGGRLELKAMQISTNGEMACEELANPCYHKPVWHLLDPLKLRADDSILRFIQPCNHQKYALVSLPDLGTIDRGNPPWCPDPQKFLIAYTCLMCCRFGSHISLLMSENTLVARCPRKLHEMT